MPSMPSQSDLDSLDVFPLDYDKAMHDYLKHTFVCECFTFILAHIPNRDPLRLVFVQRYEPVRIETPRWVDAWMDLDSNALFKSGLLDIDAVYPTMKKVAVYRPRPIDKDDGVIYGVRWATIHAQSGMFDADAEDVDSDSDMDDD